MSADKSPQHRHSARAPNRVIKFQFIENIEGVTSVIYKSHKDTYQLRQKKGLTFNV